jgi:hypothetical protein
MSKEKEIKITSIIPKSIDEIHKKIQTINPIFDNDKLKNTLNYVYNILGHKCILLMKFENDLYEFLIRPNKLPSRYFKFLPKTIKNKSKVRILAGCIIKEWDIEKKDEVPTYTTNVFQTMLKDGYKMKDGCYLITPTDAVVLKKDVTEPFNDLVGSDNLKLEIKPKNSNDFLPFLSMNAKKGYADIPIFTFDDYDYISKHPRGKIDFDKINYDWETKKELAFFRGGSTGCGWDTNSNMRLKAVQLSSMHPELIDAKLTQITNKMKVHKTRRAGFVSNKLFKIYPKIPQERYSDYKYILQIDGNVAAYRLAKTMLLGSVILIVQSDYSLWYQDLLEPFVHYVPIKSDLSNLVEMIEWCKLNDKKCKTIAKNAKKLAEKILTKKFLFEYLENIFDKTN